MGPAIDVRVARKTDIGSLARALGRAFADDPVMTWMLPDDALRTRALPRMFATMTRHHFLAGDAVDVASTSGVVGAAALWDPPGRWEHTSFEQVQMIPGFALAMGRYVRRGMLVSELMKHHHPEEPHWYLGI